MELVTVITACNVLVALFWIAGEFLVFRAENGMANEGASGKAWQKELDKFEKSKGKAPSLPP